MKGFKNTNILTPAGIRKTNLKIENGYILNYELDDAQIELDDKFIVIPGFIDEHIHGAAGSDAMDATYNDLANIAETLVKEGTTAFLATTMTQSKTNINNALSTIKNYISSKNEHGAELLGVHLEGPFISKDFVGAQPIEHVQVPNIDLFKEYQAMSGNNIKIVTIAPEVEHADELIKYLSNTNVIPSIGHTNAVYKDVKKAYDSGAKHFTHTYNAMKPIHHREIGTVGSAFLFDEMASEIICDGIHVSKEAIRLLYKNKPNSKFILITDAMRAKQMPDGISELGGQTVIVKNGEARLENGTLAGSVLKMNVAVKNIMNFLDISFEDAVKCATINPAVALGVDHFLGSLEPGKRADFTVVDKDLTVYETYRNGKLVFKLK